MVNASQLSNPVRWTITAILAPVLVYLAWTTASWGYADRQAYKARQIEKNLPETLTERLEAISQAIGYTRVAVDWSPNNPDYRDQIGKLLTKRYVVTKDPSAAQEAFEHLQHSRRIRPGWGKNWAAFIELNHHSNKIGLELSDAIIKATTYAPWEPSVLQAVTLAGVANYSALTPQAQESVQGNIQRGLASPIPRMPARTVALIEQAYRGWTVSLISKTVESLVEATWPANSDAHYASLAIRWWPLLSYRQRLALSVKVASAINTKHHLSRMIDADTALFLCPFVRRDVRKLRRACESFSQP